MYRGAECRGARKDVGTLNFNANVKLPIDKPSKNFAPFPRSSEGQAPQRCTACRAVAKTHGSAAAASKLRPCNKGAPGGAIRGQLQ